MLKAKRYQHRSETLNALQIDLFDEAELEADIQALEQELAKQQGATQNRSSDSPKSPPTQRPKRSALPAHLPRVVTDWRCEQRDNDPEHWTWIGWETSEQLAVHERQYYVKQYRRAKYVKNTVAEGEIGAPIAVAPAARLILPKALADASLLAKILTGKFIDAMSFYREHRVLEREGIHIGYSTLCSIRFNSTSGSSRWRDCSTRRRPTAPCGISMRPPCRYSVSRIGTIEPTVSCGF